MHVCTRTVAPHRMHAFCGGVGDAGCHCIEAGRKAEPHALAGHAPHHHGEAAGRSKEHGFEPSNSVGVCPRKLSEFMAVQPKKRPSFPKGTPPSFQTLVEQCWAGTQQARPSMGEIEAQLRSGKVGGFV